MKPISFAVHSYNEADALRRLVSSSLAFKDLIREWIIIDHRSDDHTGDVIEQMMELCGVDDIRVRYKYEKRDFQPGFLFADLRQMSVDLCTAPIVAVVDADYILGPGYRRVLEKANEMLLPESPYYGVAFSRPVIWDRLKTNNHGVITDHGRIWVHARKRGRVEVFRRDAAHYEQKGAKGKWEKLIPHGDRTDVYRMTQPRGIKGIEDAVVSANIKPRERIDLRRTMTKYMRAALKGKLDGSWLEEFEQGRIRNQKKYKYENIDLRGWKLNLPNLDIEV